MKAGKYAFYRSPVAWVLAGLLAGGCGSMQQARTAVGELDGEKDKEALARARGILEGSGGANPPELQEPEQ